MPTIRIDDADLLVDRAGHGESVLLIGGLSADHRSWGTFFRAASAQFDGVRYDPRGIGGSSRGRRPITAETMADDLLGLIDTLQLAPVHLVGASMGGTLAAIAATERPEQVRSLTMAVCTPKIAPADAERFTQLRQTLLDGGIEAYARAIVPLCFSEPFRRDRAADMDRIIRSLAERTSPPETIVEQIDSCLAGDITDRLGRIACPTLVLHASDDALIHRGADWTAAIPDVRTVTIGPSGHDIFVEQPDRTTREILAFLSHSPDPPA